jgi:hypothetical protein
MIQKVKRKPQLRLNVDLGLALLQTVEILRRALQDANTTGTAVSRADVVRIALRRLNVDVLMHIAGVTGPEVPARIDGWSEIGELERDPACPDWLIPKRMTEVAPSPLATKKKGKK